MSMFAQLLFTWMIAHADDYGRMQGDPAVVRALVVPMQDVTSKQVDDALTEMEAAELIVRYSADNKQYIQFPTWNIHQKGLHKRTVSKFPAPPESSGKFPDIPDNSRPTKPNIIEEKRREHHHEPEPNADDDDDSPRSKCFSLLAQLIPTLQDYHYQQLSELIEDHGPPVVLEELQNMQARGIAYDGVFPYLRKALRSRRTEAKTAAAGNGGDDIDYDAYNRA